MAAPKGPPPKAPKVDLDDLVKRWEADKKSRLFLQLAEEYRKKDALDAAMSVLREGLKHHAAFVPAHVAMARCLLAKGQLAQAQAELEPIVKKAPDNLLAGKVLAQVLQERGERQKALEVLRRLAPFAGEDEEVADRLALLTAALGTRPSSSAHSSGDTAEFATGEFAVGPGIGAPARPAERPLQPVTPLPASRPAAGVQPVEEPASEPLEAELVPDDETADDELAEARPLPAVPRPAMSADDLLGQPLAGPPADDDEDEFTSITLAELYEGQGGYREAGLIYERLLARKPRDPGLQRALERCRAREGGAPPPSVPTVAAIASPPPPPPTRPRWEPVRPREAVAQPETATESEPAPAAAFRSGPAGRDGGLRASRRELRRWLAAIEAVRAAR